MRFELNLMFLMIWGCTFLNSYSSPKSIGLEITFASRANCQSQMSNEQPFSIALPFLDGFVIWIGHFSTSSYLINYTTTNSPLETLRHFPVSYIPPQKIYSIRDFDLDISAKFHIFISFKDGTCFSPNYFFYIFY